MARSRKKSSARAASNAKAEAATDAAEGTAPGSTDGADGAETSGTAEKTVKTEKTESAKDGPAKKAGAKKAGGKRAAGTDPVKPQGGEVTEKAKDSTRSTSVKRAAAAESSRTTGRRVAASTQNPSWLAPTAVVFLVLGLAYLVTYYISAGQLPLPIGDWNLAAGFGVLMVGGGMLMFWK
ncbi:cell division protein CrgA [Brachybacterium sp. AOP43-C2-M15]|uniref:cell division protein CrgA n=1 Tax=Brachybacterium sp. AOP43-C2-M15 TaxID=3457661 RepID=UPI0040339184